MALTIAMVCSARLDGCHLRRSSPSISSMRDINMPTQILLQEPRRRTIWKESGRKRISAYHMPSVYTLGPPEPPQFPPPLDRAKHTGLRASCQVFISHAGTEKRSFVAWLYQALVAAGILTFMDEKALELGEDAASVMELEACTAQIVLCVLTPDFFVRKWPLQELHWALESKRLHGARVLPVFLEVLPDAEAVIPSMGLWLTSKGLPSKQCEEDVKELMGIVGPRPDFANGFQPPLVEKLVRRVLRILKRQPLAMPGRLVGMKERLHDALDRVKQHQSKDGIGVKIFGMSGLSGIGKRTLARAMYNRMYLDFGSRHVAIELEHGESRNDLMDKQRTMLRRLSPMSFDVDSVEHGKQLLCNTLDPRQAKVLILLNNVCSTEQRDALLPGCLRLPPGSIVIMTASSTGPLQHEQSETVLTPSPKLLSNAEAVRLLHLWTGLLTTKENAEKLEPVALACHGVALMLRVAGSYLKGKPDHRYQEVALHLKKQQPLPGMEPLVGMHLYSYNQLGHHAKLMFLDIAYMLVGKQMALVECAVQGTRNLFASQAGVDMDLLVETSLVECGPDDMLSMHNSIAMTAHHIISNTSLHPAAVPTYQALEPKIDWTFPKRDGRQRVSRLKVRGREAVERVLKNLSNYKGMVMLDMQTTKWPTWTPTAPYSGRALEGLVFLRVIGTRQLPPAFLQAFPHLAALVLAGVHGRVTPLRGSLTYLRLRDCSLSRGSLDSLSTLKKLKHLTIEREGHLQSLSDVHGLTALQELNLSGWSLLQALPAGFGCLTSLRKLKLKGCSGLSSLRTSLGTLSSLCQIDLSGCTALKALPPLSRLTSLQELDLQDCSSLASIPLEGLSSLKQLNLRDCSRLQDLPSSIGSLADLTHLDLSGCSALQCLPLEICKLTNLQTLDRSRCPGLGSLPDKICHLRSAEGGLYVA